MLTDDTTTISDDVRKAVDSAMADLKEHFDGQLSGWIRRLHRLEAIDKATVDEQLRIAGLVERIITGPSNRALAADLLGTCKALLQACEDAHVVHGHGDSGDALSYNEALRIQARDAIKRAEAE